MSYLNVLGPWHLADIQRQANMAVTGVGDLISQIKGQVAQAKQEGQDAVNSVSRSVAAYRESADAVKRVAKEIEDEAAQLVASLADVTNGGPSLSE